jgi:large subunit ribosomal protein L16
MLLRPRQTKYRKRHKVRVRGPSSGNIKLAFGSFGLKAVEGGVLTGRQLEATRVSITRALKRTGRLWIRVFPHLPVTSKPAEVRMGKGKGAVDYFVAPVKPGTILFELDGVMPLVARKALLKGSKKLPLKTKFVAQKFLS